MVAAARQPPRNALTPRCSARNRCERTFASSLAGAVGTVRVAHGNSRIELPRIERTCRNRIVMKHQPRLARARCAAGASRGHAGIQITFEIPRRPIADARETAHPLHSLARNPHLEGAGDSVRARRAWLVAGGRGSNLHHAAAIQSVWLLLGGTAGQGGCRENGVEKATRLQGCDREKSAHYFVKHTRAFGLTVPC